MDQNWKIGKTGKLETIEKKGQKLKEVEKLKKNVLKKYNEEKNWKIEKKNVK